MNFMKNRNLKVDILTAFSVLMFITIIAEILYSSSATKNLVLNFEKEYYSKTVSKTAAKRIDEYFQNIESITSILTKSINNHNIASVEEDVAIFFESLKSIPYMLSVYAGFKDGTFFQVRRIDPQTKYQTRVYENVPASVKYAIRKMFKEPTKGAIQESWIYVDEDFNEISKESLDKARYIPNKREWYVQAELRNDKTWSDVYSFMTSNELGITLSIPFSKKGDVLGVVGTDMTIGHFKNMLANTKVSENAQSYLVNEKDEIIASSNGDLLASKDSKSLITTREYTDPKLALAVDRLIRNPDKHSSFKLNGEGFVCSITKLSKLPISLITISPESDFTGTFSSIQKDMLLISLGILLLSVFFIFLLARRISTPIIELSHSANAIGALEFDKVKDLPTSNIREIQDLSKAINSMKLSITTFTKYAPKDLVTKLVKMGITPKLGGKSENITIFFSDIEKFSTISENLPAEYLILHLSEYFDELTRDIMAHGGVIDKYIGDSIMAIWGAPNKDDSHVVNACLAALSCQKLLKELKTKWAPLGKPALPTRIGLHAGEAIVGNIGSQDRMNFTAIGDNVNIASRLESANKFYGTYLLASENVENEARGQILFRVVDRIAVKGKAKGITIFEPLCSLSDANNSDYYKKIEFCAKTREAFDLYQNMMFAEAAEYYAKIQKDFPESGESINFLHKRCLEFSKNAPENWNGVFFLDKK